MSSSEGTRVPHPTSGPVPGASLKSMEGAGEGVVAADEDAAPIQPSLPFQGGSQLCVCADTHPVNPGSCPGETQPRLQQGVASSHPAAPHPTRASSSALCKRGRTLGPARVSGREVCTRLPSFSLPDIPTRNCPCRWGPACGQAAEEPLVRMTCPVPRQRGPH